MLLTIPDVLSDDQLQACRRTLDEAPWSDGAATAGHLAAKVKNNRQLPLDHPISQRIGALILEALGRNNRFIAAALPLRVLPPRFNRYEGGEHYGDHVDNAIFAIPGSEHRLRSDLSATLFLCDPDEYDGGELVVQDTYGSHRIKLPKGHLVLYPGSSLHHVAPVTRGRRIAAFFWIQSLVREDHRRALLWELDQAVQQVSQSPEASAAAARLTGVYHNLLREWSAT